VRSALNAASETSPDFVQGIVKVPQLLTWQTDDNSNFKMAGVVQWDLVSFTLKTIQRMCDPDRAGMANYFDFVGSEGETFEELEVIGNHLREQRLTESLTTGEAQMDRGLEKYLKQRRKGIEAREADWAKGIHENDHHQILNMTEMTDEHLRNTIKAFPGHDHTALKRELRRRRP
jgi:hypothetical protein